MPAPATNVIQLESNDKPISDPEKLHGLGGFCQDLYTEYKGSSYRTTKLTEISDGRKKYKGDRVPKSFPWKDCSNLSVGLDAIAVDNLEPRVYHQ